MSKKYSRARRRQQSQQQKYNPNYSALIYSETPQAQSMPRNYKNYIKEGYRGNNTVYKCISYITRNAAAIPAKLYTDDTMKDEIKQHPLLDKLKKPNNEQSGVDYLEAVLGFLLLSGNSYQYAIRNRNAPPDELWPLRPDYTEVMAAKPRGIASFKYETLDEPIAVEDVGYLRYWCPDEDSYGMSPLEAAAIEVDQIKAAKKWNLALLQNSGKMTGFWTTPAIMSKPDRDKAEQKLNEKFNGPKNAGKMSVLDGGLSWQSMSLPPNQMDWLDAIKFNGGSIADIYFLPPQLIGDTSSTTYDNYEQAKQAAYTEAIFPLLDKYYALQNAWIVQMYPDLASSGAYLYYDKKSVEVIASLLQAKLTAESERASNLWMNGLMMQDEARELAQLPPVPGGQGKIFRIGGILVPANNLMEYAEQSLTTPAAPPPAQPEPLDVPLQGDDQQNDEDKPDDKPDNSEGDNKPDPANSNPRGGGKSGRNWDVKALNLETSEQKKAYADSVESARERWYGKAEQRLQDYFKEEQKTVVDAIKNAALPSSADIRAEHALNAQEDDLKDVLVSIYQDVGQDIGSDVLKELKAGSGPTEQKDIISNFIKWFSSNALVHLLSMAAKKVTQINDTTRAHIQSELSDGVANGESIPQLAKRIDSLYLQQIIPNRSTVIARTEVIGTSNWAAIQAAKQSDLTLKKVWLATEDARTRPAHAEADGQEVDMDDDFTVDGEKMSQPGDPSASAGNVVNCRCTVFFRRVSSNTEDDTDESEDNEKQHVIVLPVNRMPGHRKALKSDYRAFMEATLR